MDHADYRNGVRSAYGHDGRGMISSIQQIRADGANLSNRTYWRDERDRITAYQKSTNNTSVNPMENGRGDRFRYDEEGQLVEAWYNASDPANSGNGATRYDGFAYDALGNRTQNNYVASRGLTSFVRRDNGLNQYDSWSPSVIYQDDNSPWPGYDALPGNGVTMADGWIAASYNALNQPIVMGSVATYPTGNWIWFGYDPLGRCVKRTVGPTAESGTSTYFYYEGWNLIQEGPSSATASRNYVHGARVDEIVKQITPNNWWERYFHYDARGHCTLQTDSAGTIVEQYEYDAFGQFYFYNAWGTDVGYSAWGNRFLFTGREYLSDLKLYDYRNRLYQPELGRFMQPDPKEFAAGDYNLYRYCHNDRVNKTDPMGLDAPTVVVRDKEAKALIEANLKDLLKLAAFKQHFDKTKKDNVIRHAEDPENESRGKSPNGLRTNNTVRHFGFRELLRDALELFGHRTQHGEGATIFYDPKNRQTATGGDRAPIFGLANELGEMINANNGTWGLPNSTDNDNRSIWFENQAREAYGAAPRPYY